MRNIKYLVVHCTATSRDTTITSIQDYWRRKLGWRSPGYHKIIKADGEVVTLATDDKITNGVAGYNSVSLHVSYIGGVDRRNNPFDTRTEEQNKSLEKVLREWKKKYPDAEIRGHRDFPKVRKACPSFDVKSWLKIIDLK